jgi:hypothetical protein
VCNPVAQRHPDADVIVPLRSTAVPSDMAESTPTQRDRHLQSMAEHGRGGWQTRSGYTRRSLVETAVSRCKRVMGDGLRSQADQPRRTEIAIAVHVLNRMLLGRPRSVRVACMRAYRPSMRPQPDPCNKATFPANMAAFAASIVHLSHMPPTLLRSGRVQ